MLPEITDQIQVQVQKNKTHTHFLFLFIKEKKKRKEKQRKEDQVVSKRHRALHYMYTLCAVSTQACRIPNSILFIQTHKTNVKTFPYGEAHAHTAEGF